MPAIEHTILPAAKRSRLNGSWHGDVWGDIPFLDIARFRPESSKHRPVTRAKMLYSPDGILGLFQVKDQYIRCTRSQFQDEVYKDSCVEFFVQPGPDRGYFNFEFNCGGTLLASYILDSARTENGFKDFVRLTPEAGKQISIFHSMPKIVDPEIINTATWYIDFFIPYSVLETYTGPVKPEKGDVWRGNFYKCGDETSHPHWASWAPVDELNFHLPDNFGILRFG